MSDMESDLVERKESAVDGRKIRRNICAFANDLPGNGKPGVVFVGVRDDGSCASLSIDDELLTRLANIHGEGDILPLPSMTVQKRVLLGCAVAVITVEPSLDTPVRFKGRVWVRVGPSVREGSVEDERLLGERRRAADLPFDMRPATGPSVDDLDLDFTRNQYLPNAISPQVLDRNERSIEHQLRSLRMIQSGRPTWGALLALGRDPQAFLPGAYVQLLRIDGTEITDPIRDQKQLTGRLDDVVRRLDELIELNVSVRTQVAGDCGRCAGLIILLMLCVNSPTTLSCTAAMRRPIRPYASIGSLTAWRSSALEVYTAGSLRRRLAPAIPTIAIRCWPRPCTISGLHSGSDWEYHLPGKRCQRMATPILDFDSSTRWSPSR